jgi:hypothetical protein
MSRIAFCCVWLVLPACFAQTTTLRPDAVPAEDPEMRAEAVRLMERADMLTTPVWPANEEFVDFRVLQPAPGETSEGSMKIGVKTPANKRWEFTYGTYKFIKVQNGSEFATFRSESAEPAALTSVRRLVPVFQGRFEPADMIRHIEDSTVDGRPARCIDFDTLRRWPASMRSVPARSLTRTGTSKPGPERETRICRQCARRAGRYRRSRSPVSKQ